MSEQEKEEPRALTLEERWQMDEEMQADGISNYEVFTPQCRSCRFAKKENVESCQQYEEIPWEVLTVQEPCPYYRRQKDLKPQIQCMAITNKEEILQYDFLPEEVLEQIQKFPTLAIWAYDGDEPVCAAVFTQKLDHQETLAILQYIYTLENYRSLGVATDVVKYAEKVCLESKITHIKAYTEEQMLTPFFETIGWCEVPCNCRKLEYSPKKLMSETLKTFVPESKRGILCLTADVRRRILLEDHALPLELKEYLKDDHISDHSLIYVLEHKVEGAVLLEKKTGYQMCIRLLYVCPENSDKTIVLKLLAAVLGCRENWSGSGNVLICAKEDHVMKLTEYLFGKPDRERKMKLYRNWR